MQQTRVWARENGIQYYNTLIDAYPGMPFSDLSDMIDDVVASGNHIHFNLRGLTKPSPAEICLLYTSPSPRDRG